MKKIFAACLFGFASLTATASEWHFYNATRDGVFFFFDKETVKRNGNNVTVWARNIATRQEISANAWEHLAQYRINCKTPELHILAITMRDKNQKTTLVLDKMSEHSSIPPDSTLDSLRQIVCHPKLEKAPGTIGGPVPNNDPLSFAQKNADKIAP